MTRLSTCFLLAPLLLASLQSFAEDISEMGSFELILNSDLTVGANTIYAEIGKTSRPSAETRGHIGYGIYISSWLNCTDLCYLKMNESSPQRRVIAKGSAIVLDGSYQEYRQDGYVVQEFLVSSPKEIHGVICYSHCSEYRSLMGVPEDARKVSFFAGPRITLEGFKELVRQKARLQTSPPVLIYSPSVNP